MTSHRSTIELTVDELDPKQYETTRQQLEQIVAPVVGFSPCPFVLVSPLGLPYEIEFTNRCKQLGVEFTGRSEFDDFRRLATHVYLRVVSAKTIYRAIAHEQVWQLSCPNNHALILWLRSEDDRTRLEQHKRELRAHLPEQPVRLICPVGTTETALHAFHLPDGDRVAVESARIVRLLNANTT